MIALWQMGWQSKKELAIFSAKSKQQRDSFLNISTIECCGTKENFKMKITKPNKSCNFLTLTIESQKVQKWLT